MILITLCFLYYVKCLIAEVTFHIEPSSPIVAVENATFFIKCIAEDTTGKINISTKFIAGGQEIKTTPDNHIVVTTTYNGSKTIVELSISVIQAKDLYNHNILYCSTPNSDYQMDVFILSEQRVPKFVDDAPTTLSTVYGSDFSFSCSVVSERSEKYHVDIEWGFDGKLGSNIKYIPDASNQTFLRSKVIISDVKYSNRGKYSCIAKLSFDFYVKRFTKIFDLAEISAEKNQPPKEEIVKAGSDVTLVCDNAGYPAPKYVWKKFDAVIDNFTDSRFKFIKENSSEYETLTINNVTYSDRAVYSCIVNFNNSQVVREFALRVRDPLNALWPAVGILIEAVLLAIIIFLCEACKKSNQAGKNYKMKENEETSPLVFIGWHQMVKLKYFLKFLYLLKTLKSQGYSPTKVVYSEAEDSARL
ncbi:neural cell adhesion molecule 1-like [Hydra vulgaris]|uniref:Neural cell adhesion molecule 1-like n=1 Tax=Hydra vulgaris TaxID=6087 RepID=A0ABM4DAE7_HYDVU